MDLSQPGIGAVLRQGERILVPEQLPVVEDEGVALQLGLGEPGAEVLSGHGTTMRRRENVGV
jgi:hypothetical protein